MKRFFIALSVALLALVFMVSPALAWGGTDVSVDCGDITVSDDAPSVGTVITFYGTVTISATAGSNIEWGQSGVDAGASSNAWFIILDPDGNIVASGGNPLDSYSGGLWYWSAYADASQTYDWTVDVLVDIAGDYVAQQGGEASAFYGHWYPDWSTPNPWDVIYVLDGASEDSCTSDMTLTCLGGQAILNKPHPVLTIELPDGRKLFYGSDGYDNPTDQPITFTDGTWQVDVSAGTVIELDGKWHMLTQVIVDSQGGITCSYGKSHIVATDIGLSKPITVTKVG